MENIGNALGINFITFAILHTPKITWITPVNIVATNK